MAFGVTRAQLNRWKNEVSSGRIAYLTHYWLEPRWPGIKTVTKVGCADKIKLARWCLEHGLNPAYIHDRAPFPHFDLIGEKQKEILLRERLYEHIERFRL